MCGDHSSRAPTIDSGDLVAIIHPSSQQRSIFSGGRLHFSNRFPGSTVSTLNCGHPDHSGIACGSSSSSSIPSQHCSSSLSSSLSSSPSSFDNDTDSYSFTPSSRARAALLSVRIHKFGQPLLSVNGGESANPVLHSFVISPATSAGAGVCEDESCLVGRRLNLGVGGDGVVGRTVSLVDERRQVVLGEGVIGWI